MSFMDESEIHERTQRVDLAQRIAHASSEAEAALWRTVKAQFPEASHGDLPPEIIVALWHALDNTVRAWCVENVPGAVEALANYKGDVAALEGAPRHDERDQT